MIECINELWFSLLLIFMAGIAVGIIVGVVLFAMDIIEL